MHVATTSSGDDMDVASSAYENTSTTDNGTACSALYSNSGSSGVVAAVDGGQDSDSSLVYENAADGTGLFSIPTVANQNKVQYISVGNFDTEEMGERSLDQLNHSIYSYKTRYMSTFRVGKAFERRLHKGCHQRIKLISHHAGEAGNKFQILQEGEHDGTVVNFTTKDISPILKPEVDVLLKLGMAAGWVRNMLLFKYSRDPTMLKLVPETKKMECRKRILKRLAADGWEISEFMALEELDSGKVMSNGRHIQNPFRWLDPSILRRNLCGSIGYGICTANSLQHMTVYRRALTQINPLIPKSKWRFNEIRSIRNVFRSTCIFLAYRLGVLPRRYFPRLAK
ncbi:hypothetical protein F442_13127 [Phytophthora nicotianae P10297]|uniref:Uncharacterized protein n=1 Tax=Phytophthora nicotianae P10297 TaxID=1317064 RepID=W2YX82_PHYNI|nr:hypothetical protein F442_13127 [Phytophthora nicotianae P10297]